MGGGEINLQTIATALAEQGHAISILTSYFSELKPYEEIKEVKIYRRLKTGQNPSTFKNNLIRSLKFPKSIQRETKKITLEIKPDIIHFIGTSIIAAPKLRSLGIPLFATIESYPTLCPKGDRWYRGKEECKVVCSLRQFVPCQSHSKEIGKMKNKWYLKYNPFFLLFVYNHYQKLNQALQHCQLIAISDYVKNLLIQQGHASTVIPNALDLKPFQKAQKKGKDNAGKPRILFLGSLMESKGPQVLLEAIKGINCRCDLYGEGAMKEQLQQIIDQNHLDAMIHAPVPYREIPEIYAQADVVVFPSLWPEPFGRIAIEAQAAGKMVIGSDIGGIKETMADGGFLVAPGNIIALQQQLNSQLDHQPLMRIPDKSTYRRQIIAKKLNQLYQT